MLSCTTYTPTLTDILIPNCLKYNHENNCELCEEGYVVN